MWEKSFNMFRQPMSIYAEFTYTSMRMVRILEWAKFLGIEVVFSGMKNDHLMCFTFLQRRPLYP